MNATQKAVLEVLNNIKDDIVSSINALGLRASGASSSFALVRPKGQNGGRLELLGYVRFLFDRIGRRPGKVSQDGQQAIGDWIQSKGVQPKTFDGRLQTLEQQIFMVSRSIAERGTSIFRGAKGIPLDKILQDNINDGTIGKGARLDTIEELDKQIIELNAKTQAEAK